MIKTEYIINEETNSLSGDKRWCIQMLTIVNLYFFSFIAERITLEAFPIYEKYTNNKQEAEITLKNYKENQSWE